jgi:hypothetical protein
MDSIHDLFNRAKQLVGETEARLANLQAQSRSLDRQLLDRARDMPIVWVTGPARARAKAQLLFGTSNEDGVHPLRLETKYYTANALVNTTVHATESEDSQHAIILALEDIFDETGAETVFDSVGEVRVCICDDARTGEWCVAQGVEWIKWEDIERLSEALESTTWPNMIMKNPPIRSIENNPVKFVQPPASKQTVELSPEQQLEAFERLMVRAREIRDNAPNMSDAERRQRAAQAAEEMVKLFGMDEESDSE